MKSQYIPIFIIGLLCIILLISMGFNYYLFNQSLQYYQDLHSTRLDPLGLSYFTESQELGNGTIVVFFGDSRAESWPPPPNLAGFEFINRGIGAQTTAQVSQRFDEHVLPLHPHLIILQVSTT
jgi:hypothetical protein